MRLAPALVAALALIAPSTAAAMPPPFGGLTHIGCVTVDGSDGACATGHAFAADGYPPLVLSPDGRSAYAGQDEANAVAVLARDPATGALSQLPGPAGCVSEDGSGGQCGDGVALNGAFAPVVSPDGRNVYASADSSNAITAFQRDPVTGALTQLPGQAGCVSDDGTGGACVDGRFLADARGVAVSPDGKNVYLATAAFNGVDVFSRNPDTGVITQLPLDEGCVLDAGGGVSLCTDGRGLQRARNVTVSADGLNVYVAADAGDSIAVFSRHPATGTLEQLPGLDGCISASGSGGECEKLTEMSFPRRVALSPDGRNAYVSKGGPQGGVIAFSRDPGTGALTQLPGAAGCVTADGSGGACAVGRAVASGNDVEVSPDGKNVYLASIDPTSAFTSFDRNPATGALTQLPGTAGCASETGDGGACLLPPAFRAPDSVAVSPDGRNVYTHADGKSNMESFARELPPTCTDVSHAVLFGAPTAIPLACSDPNGDPISRTIVSAPASGRLAAVSPGGSVVYTPKLRFGGADSFSFRASDGSLDSNVAVASLSVTADTIRPRISRASVSPRVFAVRAAGTARLKRSTTFRYRLSEPARVVITLKRAVRRRHRHGRRLVTAGRLTQTGKQGANKLALRGRVHRRKLRRGSYRALLVATDPAGNRSKQRKLSFRIVSAKHH